MDFLRIFVSVFLIGILPSSAMAAQHVRGSGASAPHNIRWCGTSRALALTAAKHKSAFEPVIDIAIDRQSFVRRGWSGADLGSWNNGSMSVRNRRGLFLSAFYGLALGNPSTPNSWQEPVDDWDRGLAAHIDYAANEALQKGNFRLYIYDRLGAPTQRGVIVGRRLNEEPFNAGSCKGAIGCADGSDKIYLRTDYDWALGYRTDYGAWIKVGSKYYYNISLVIAHEVGHFFGLSHFNHEQSIMNAVAPMNNARWRNPPSLNEAITGIARKIYP